MDALLAALVEHHILQRLEILGNGGAMALGTTLKLSYHADGFTTLVNHLECMRNLANLQCINSFGNLGWQILHTELRRGLTGLHHIGAKQSLGITGILIVRDERCGILESELLGTQIVGDRIQTGDGFLNSLVRNNRLAQNVAHVYLIATLLDELNDMKAKLRLYNLRHLLWVGEVESHLSKGRIECASAHQAKLTTTTSRTGILRI